MRLEYTEQVQEVLAVMEDCAQRMRYGYVGTEHLLYGLLCCEDVRRGDFLQKMAQI